MAEDKHKFSVRLPVKLYERVKQLADVDYKTVNRYIHDLVVAHVKRTEAGEEEGAHEIR